MVFIWRKTNYIQSSNEYNNCKSCPGPGRAGKQAGFEGAGVNLPACPVFMRLSRRHFLDEHPLRKLKLSHTRVAVSVTFVKSDTLICHVS